MVTKVKEKSMHSLLWTAFVSFRAEHLCHSERSTSVIPSGAKESLSAGMIAGMNTHGGISESVNKVGVRDGKGK